MSIKTVAIIEPFVFQHDEFDRLVPPLFYRTDVEQKKKDKIMLNEYIWDRIKDHIEFIDVDENMTIDGQIVENPLLEVICPILLEDINFDNSLMCVTEPSFSTPDGISELIYFRHDVKHDDVTNLNTLGCYFSLSHTPIKNKCVLIWNNFDLSAKHRVRFGSITKELIVKFIRKRFFTSAILIKQKSFEKLYYQDAKNLAKYIFGEEKTESFRKDIFRYGLIFHHTNNKMYVNEVATRISGRKMYGDVLIIHEVERNPETGDVVNYNIGMKEMKRINAHSYGSNKDRDLRSDEIDHCNMIIDYDKGKEQIPLWSRYLVIKNRIISHNNINKRCIKCKNIIEGKINYKCNECFRAIYCSHECQEMYSNEHESECIHD